MKKYISKINKLTEKLHRHGDITEDETDYIYWLYETSYINMGFSSKGYLAFIDEEEEKLLNNSLHEWYKEAFDNLKIGRRGNFVAAFPVNPRILFYGVTSEALNLLKKTENEFVESPDISKYSDMSRLLHNDICIYEINGETTLRLNRYGLKNRLRDGKYDRIPNESAKDLTLMRTLTRKLKEEDISEDESDFIYCFMQKVSYMNRDCESFPDFIRESEKVVIEWMNTAVNLVRSGKTGVFVTSVPFENISLNVSELHAEFLKSLNFIDRSFCILAPEETENKIKEKFSLGVRGQTPLRLNRAGILNNSIDLESYCVIDDISDVKSEILVEAMESICIYRPNFENVALVPKERKNVLRYLLSVNDEEAEQMAKSKEIPEKEIILQMLLDSEKRENVFNDEWIVIEK